jgi:hypothetical protein
MTVSDTTDLDLLIAIRPWESEEACRHWRSEEISYLDSLDAESLAERYLVRSGRPPLSPLISDVIGYLEFLIPPTPGWRKIAYWIEAHFLWPEYQMQTGPDIPDISWIDLIADFKRWKSWEDLADIPQPEGWADLEVAIESKKRALDARYSTKYRT